MSQTSKARLDKPSPKIKSEDFDIGVYATRLLSYTRKITNTSSGFTKKSKYNGDISAAMDAARNIMKTAYMANEMPRYEPYLSKRLMLIREIIGECSYFENLIYSFWESGYINGDVWNEWCKHVGTLKGRCVSWFNTFK